MFQHYHDAKIPNFQIDPDQKPLFKLLQQVNDVWCEVGFVWTEGKSRTNSVEHWYLYNSVPASNAEKLSAYAWAGRNAKGQIVGMTLRLEPFSPPADVSPAAFKAHLEQQKGVSVTYVKGDMSSG